MQTSQSPTSPTLRASSSRTWRKRLHQSTSYFHNLSPNMFVSYNIKFRVISRLLQSNKLLVFAAPKRLRRDLTKPEDSNSDTPEAPLNQGHVSEAFKAASEMISLARHVDSQLKLVILFDLVCCNCASRLPLFVNLWVQGNKTIVFFVC